MRNGENNLLKEKLISIVVPVYNTEKYLSTCIDSILNQTYNNLQLILVDDGSTDNSILICRQYEFNNQKVKFIEKPHTGLINTRKVGLQYADGEYIVFADSDDWYEATALEVMSQYMEDECDMVVAGYIRYVDAENKSIVRNNLKNGYYKFKDLKKEVFYNMMFDMKNNGPDIIQSVCSKIFKKDILLSCYDNVYEDITLGEDAIITYQYILKCKKIYILDDALYYYRQNVQSMCFEKDISKFREIQIFKDNICDIFSTYSNSQNLINQVKYYVLHRCC